MSDRQVAAPVSAQAPRPGDTAGAPMTGRAVRWVNRLTRLVSSRPFRWGFVAVAVGLAAYALATEWTGVRTALAHIGLLRILAAFVGVLIATVATMQVWRVLIAALGSPLPARASARILFLGQLGKYLPGSIWPVLAQMELASEHQVPRHRSASASVLTMLLALLSGLLVALATLPFVARAAPYRWVFLVTPVLLVCLHPKLLNRLLGWLLRLARRPALEQPLSGPAIAGALVWSLVSWLGYGLQIWLLVTRLGAPYGRGALLAIGGFAFAWCVGFVVVFAPAGAGVREVLLIAILGPVVGVAGATAVALVSRVLTTLSDLLTAAAAVAWSRRSRSGPGQAEMPDVPGDSEGSHPA
jgi:glycosyltransferase 2 family protein